MPEHPVVPLSVLRHFATQRDEVHGLAARDAGFRDMCEEFAEAETALARIGKLSADVRDVRLEECQGWIERLILEMQEALSTAKVIPLPQRPAERLP